MDKQLRLTLTFKDDGVNLDINDDDLESLDPRQINKAWSCLYMFSSLCLRASNLHEVKQIIESEDEL